MRPRVAGHRRFQPLAGDADAQVDLGRRTDPREDVPVASSTHGLPSSLLRRLGDGNAMKPHEDESMTEHSEQVSGPLAGIRVLDFTALLQGPLATQILADLGADVVKLEKQDGEWMRQWGIFMRARTARPTPSSPSTATSAASRSTCKDPGDLRAHPRARRQGRRRRRELPARRDGSRRPRLRRRCASAIRGSIYAASSGYGRTGPYASRPGQDYLVQALTGAMWLTGRRDDPPFVFGAAIADQFTGLHLVHRHPGRAPAPQPHRRGSARRRGPARPA